MKGSVEEFDVIVAKGPWDTRLPKIYKNYAKHCRGEEKPTEKQETAFLKGLEVLKAVDTEYTKLISTHEIYYTDENAVFVEKFDQLKAYAKDTTKNSAVLKNFGIFINNCNEAIKHIKDESYVPKYKNEINRTRKKKKKEPKRKREEEEEEEDEETIYEAPKTPWLQLLKVAEDNNRMLKKLCE